jgi:DNA-binding NtrC family response regulator
VNCAAIPPELLEAEMFGHEAGAFTGAVRARDGMMQQAHGGTLFLDEVGDLSPQHQARLLRAVETGAFRTVGGTTEVLVDVRIVAATNRPLTGTGAVLRADLYQRLAGMRIDLPPLRERGNDVLLLAEHFRSQYAAQSLARPESFTDAARDALLHYPWPGNVRELRNVVERACHTATWNVIDVADLHIEFAEEAPVALKAGEGTLEDLEKAHIAKALADHGGNVHEAAKSLGMARSTLYYRIAKLGLRPPRRGE